MQEKIRKTGDCRWELPRSCRKGMRVPGIIFASDALMADILRDKSLEQVANAAFLPGIVKASLAMPDIHYGYGLPIGGVVATRVSDGVISPGGVGFDINCGVRLARTKLHREELGDKGTLRSIADALQRDVPAGVGAGGRIRLKKDDEEKVMTHGAGWAVARGFGTAGDLEKTEAGGCLQGADPGAVSEKARRRGRDQQGTLGSGNHFVELQYVDKIYDGKAAGAYGLQEGSVTVMVHSGSRGFGHQICTDYLEVMDRAVRKYGIELPDKQLACAPVASPEGERYEAAMKCAANYAWANRQCLMWWVAETLAKTLGVGRQRLGLSLVYDVAHNMVKRERHTVEGREMELAVHRKGATRAFPPGHREVPAAYAEVGQPVIIPGDMGRYSYVLCGRDGAMQETFGSCCHGAGRRMSRRAALRAARGRSLLKELEARGTIARCTGRDTLGEEMPEAYKDVAEVVNVVHTAGLAERVARLRPLAVVKG
jgi:tRNA-splicing ligase RtcB